MKRILITIAAMFVLTFNYSQPDTSSTNAENGEFDYLFDEIYFFTGVQELLNHANGQRVTDYYYLAEQTFHTDTLTSIIQQKTKDVTDVAKYFGMDWKIDKKNTFIVPNSTNSKIIQLNLAVSSSYYSYRMGQNKVYSGEKSFLILYFLKKDRIELCSLFNYYFKLSLH